MTGQQRREWIAKVAPAAQASQSEFGIPASVVLAQAILESDWGRSSCALEHNNFFGIKARAGQDYCEHRTTEFVNGKAERPVERFRRFRTAADCFRAHATLLSRARRYEPAMAVAHDPILFAMQLRACGYATDPKYPSKLGALIQTWNLSQYDSTSKPRVEAAKA